MFGQRNAEVKKCVEICCQFVIQNTCTDRQVKHKSKKDSGFVWHVETPLSIGLPMTIHQRVCDKNLIRVLSSVYLGTWYEQVLNITKHIERVVVLRMTETGGYCLPDFIKKGIPLFFAVDNIDFLEDTPYGQDTLHGTVIVVCQKEDENTELINPPLAIPDKLPSSPLHVNIMYKDDPLIQLKPIKFTSYTIGQRANLLKPYHLYDETWALANHMAKNNDCVTQSSSVSLDTDAEINLGDDFAPRSTDASSSAIHESVHPIAIREGNTTTLLENGFAPRRLDIATTTISEHELAPTTIDVAMPSIHEDDNADTTYEETILNVAPKKIRKEKRQKSEVMPTWAAVNSLLQPIQNVDRTNSEVVAPLFKTSPTDYATFYIVLSLHKKYQL